MGRRFPRYEDWCPECGRLLPKKAWNCSFCGCSSQGLTMDDSEIDFWGDYLDVSTIASIDEPFDLLFDNA